MRTLALVVALGVSTPMPGAASPQNDANLAGARRLFLEIESAARSPVDQQPGFLPRVYRDVCPALKTLYVAHTVFGAHRAADNSESPTQAADRLERAGGWPALGEAGRRRCSAFLTAHRDRVESLIREDLRGGSSQEKQWALFVIGETRAVRLLDAAIAALGSRDPDPIYAAQALRDLDDPRAIPALIRSVPGDPTRFYETLRSLQRKRAAHPQLLELLQSKDAQVRWRAAYALVDSRDETLVPLLPGLVADPAADVRRQAGYIAVSFDAATYGRLRSSIAALLTDADTGVRADIAVAVASRMDRASGPALLALVEREATLDSWRQSNVTQAIQTLTGSYFGLTPGTPSSPEVRGKALAAFGEWVKKNPPEAR